MKKRLALPVQASVAFGAAFILYALLGVAGVFIAGRVNPEDGQWGTIAFNLGVALFFALFITLGYCLALPLLWFRPSSRMTRPVWVYPLLVATASFVSWLIGLTGALGWLLRGALPPAHYALTNMIVANGVVALAITLAVKAFDIAVHSSEQRRSLNGRGDR